jgi:hypothetical protein
MKITTPISVGDFIDRLSILEIKSQKGLKVDLELEEYKNLSTYLKKWVWNLLRAYFVR